MKRQKTECYELDLEECKIVRLMDISNSTAWISDKQSLSYVIAPCDVDNKIKVEEIEFKLRKQYLDISQEIISYSDSNIEIEVDFPTLKLNTNVLTNYCFPALNPTISDVPVKLDIPYSTWFPMQFMSFWNNTGSCLTLLSDDSLNETKFFRLEKDKKGLIKSSVHYQITLKPRGKIQLKAILGIGSGDWHNSLKVYQDHWRRKHQQCSREIKWLSDTYTFRQWFLHKNYDVEIWDQNNKTFRAAEKLHDDMKNIGGIDYVQLFDWAYEPQLGRLGEYAPWDYLCGSDKLNTLVSYLQQNNVRVGLYFEGYLQGKSNSFIKVTGDKCHVRDENNSIYSYVGEDYYTLCMGDDTWSEWLKSRILKVIEKIPNIDAIYVDEFCCGIQYPCFSDRHAHVNGNNQLKRENAFLQKLRNNIPPKMAIITEYFPTDETIVSLDASLTYANPIINLTRFVFPQFRQFVIIKCDAPLKNDVDAVKRIFFNGQGIWLSGNVHDEQWFGKDFLELVKKAQHILSGNKEFCSCQCTPLLYGKEGEICINEFRSDDKVIWTLYNTSNQNNTITCTLPDNVNTAVDVWNNRIVKITKNKISIGLPAGEIGCIKFSVT